MKTPIKLFITFYVVCLCIFSTGYDRGTANRYSCDQGEITLRSVATLELIKAKSENLRGVIEPENQTFAWSVEIRSFQGFNSPLQREHFNENYMESNRYSRASFSGKIIEKVDFSQLGTQWVRAKGVLNIHGVEQERIIKSQLENKNGRLIVSADFTVPVADHNITIPRIVHQKIAEEIQVTINAVLTRK